MADLDSLEATEATRIVGSDAGGTETNAVNADSNGNLQVKDFSTKETGAAVPSAASYLGAKDELGNLAGITTTQEGSKQGLDANIINDVKTHNTIDSGTYGAINVGTSPIEAKVGASRLSGRKILTVYNNSNKDIYWGFNNSVTTSTGTKLFSKQLMFIEASDSLGLFLIADSANNDIRITEGA